MTGIAIELLDLVARWVHVIAGIMWVGNSLLFNWLDRNLVAHPDREQQSIWLLHSGGFYFVEKTLLPGQQLPAPLHWFKWQAYTTWLSGVALLLIVYWAGGRATMGAAPGNQPQAVAIGAGAIFIGWLAYESMNRFVAPRAPSLSLIAWVSALIAISFGLTRAIDGRAAYLHVGAMLGTIMAGNVFFTIVPSQRQLVAAVASGRRSSAAADSARAKRVSIHNNYFTFPVIALMVSSHFPSVYSGALSWAKLMVLIAGGALIRLILNIRYSSRSWLLQFGAVTALTFGVLFILSTRAPVTAPVDAGVPVPFVEVRRVIDRRCSVCHSAQPADVAFGVAPGGVAFDTPEQIATHANRINERAAVSRTMPPANKTRINDAERDLIARWFAQGAPTRSVHR